MEKLTPKSKNKVTKVLQVFASLNVGGAESRMMDVYRKIDKNDVTFDFVTLEEGKQFFEEEIEDIGGKIIHIQSPRKVGMLKHIRALRNCIKNGKYDAIHAHTSYHSGCVMFAAFLEKVPVRIAHARTTDSIQKGFKTKLFISIGRFLNNLFATKRVAISAEAGKFVFGKKSFEIIPNAIDLEKYYISENIAEYKKSFGISKEKKVIGHVGRFDKFKNQNFLIDWFSRFPRKDNFYLVLVGDGEKRKELENKAKVLNIQDKIIFTGVRNDVQTLMKMFDLLVFPSIVEGLGGVILEAQAAGTPVIASTAIPDEVDMGLNLVERCSLKENFEIWDLAAENSLNKERPKFDTIQDAFNKHHYTLEYTVQRLTNIYKNNK